MTRTHMFRAIPIAAAALLLATPAAATVTITGTFYYDKVQANCNSTSQCAMDFATVPAGKRVTVRNLSCGWLNFSGTQSAVALTFQANTNSFTSIFQDFYAVPQDPAGARLFNTTVHSDTFGAVVPAGAYPRVTLNLSSQISTLMVLTCSLAGTIN